MKTLSRHGSARGAALGAAGDRKIGVRAAGHEKAAVRARLAENPAAPRDLLAVLAEDENPDVRKAALRRFAPKHGHE
ncbi:MAG: hypothetical protein LBE06_12240 [Azoarcus sp.]|nr:hypothetical protein [Azoarcus sp.]